jgi:8-oxo-dGTP pyrophosphatase MutT (NUDIX family)
MSKYLFCNNCGNAGHLYQKCRMPILSMGVIAYRKVNNKYEYLMIRRRNSLGYVDFIRGKYALNNELYLQKIVEVMTVQEINDIQTEPFEKLWDDLWRENKHQYVNEYLTAKEKHSKLKRGYHLMDTFISLATILRKKTSIWIEPEWGFPKGRRNYKENDYSCAIREWEEETGYNRNLIDVINNIVPYIEIFLGTNNKSYKYKYFIARFKDSHNIVPTDYEETEVSLVKWCNYAECISLIRPYSPEKKETITKLNKALTEYTLYI